MPCNYDDSNTASVRNEYFSRYSVWHIGIDEIKGNCIDFFDYSLF